MQIFSDTMTGAEFTAGEADNRDGVAGFEDFGDGIVGGVIDVAV
ncbi:MAG: hypothetical protein WBY66_25565 [Candidatus Acidiferrales bacterium]